MISGLAAPSKFGECRSIRLGIGLGGAGAASDSVGQSAAAGCAAAGQQHLEARCRHPEQPPAGGRLCAGPWSCVPRPMPYLQSAMQDVSSGTGCLPKEQALGLVENEAGHDVESRKWAVVVGPGGSCAANCGQGCGASRVARRRQAVSRSRAGACGGCSLPGIVTKPMPMKWL